MVRTMDLPPKVVVSFTATVPPVATTFVGWLTMALDRPAGIAAEKLSMIVPTLEVTGAVALVETVVCSWM